MGKFDGVLLCSDFDNTLYNSYAPGNEITAEDLAALRYFIAQGGRFAVATGRAHRTFTPYVPQLPINAPVVLSNGAELYDYAEEHYLVQKPVPLTAVEDLSILSEEMPSIGVEVYHGDHLYIQNPNAYTDAHIRKVRAEWTRAALTEMPLPWSKVVLQDDPAQLKKAQAFLLERWGARYEVIFSAATLLEVTAKGATKGDMVLELAGRLGIGREHIYCVGDNQNDIPMLAAAAIGFAPSSCTEAVLEWGKARLVKPCPESCVADVISILDQMY